MGRETYTTVHGETLFVKDCEDKDQLHTCPYKIDIHDDYSLCNCDEDEEKECSDSI